MLSLVVADGDEVGAVDQDVGRHQHRVGEQPDADGLLAGGLLLELGHPAQLAEGGGALEDPGELGVLGNVALQEDRAAPGIEADCQETAGNLDRPGAQRLRVDVGGEGVQVDDAEDPLVDFLAGNPLAECAEVVADVRRA